MLATAFAGSHPGAVSVSPSGRLLLVPSADQTRLTILAVRTGRERSVDSRVALGATPLWSPGSRRFSVSTPGGGVAVVDAATGKARTVAASSSGTTAYATGWSPDGSRLLVTRWTPTQPELELVDVASRTVEDLGTGADAAFSRDGTRIAYDANGATDVLNLDSGARTTVASGRYPEHGLITWSADGRELAYVEGDTSGRPNVLVAAAADGSGSRVMAAVPAVGGAPLWSGSRLVWLPRLGRGIAVGDPRTGATRVLLPRRAVGPLGVLANGRIVYETNSRTLRTVEPDGRNDAPLA